MSGTKADLDALLRDVSRSFYRTLNVLPPGVRRQMGLAYLLARTTDTIADTALVPLEQRLAALGALRDRILGTSGTPLDLGELARGQGAEAERRLLERGEAALAALAGFEAADQERIRAVLKIITSGQELDLRRFAGASAERIVALATEEELDDYTYRVAGCVGEFWTRMCRAHVLAEARVDDGFLMANGRRFGQGLQLVNILRDVPVDLRNGRCYVPAPALAAAGLRPEELLEAKNEPRFRAVYRGYLAKAEAHLASGWAYTNALPKRRARLRLACAWPILIGMKTLAKLRAGNVLNPALRIKVSRPEVKRLIVRSVLCYPWPGAWGRLFAEAGAGGESCCVGETV